MKKNLVWVSTESLIPGKLSPLFNSRRDYDVMVHIYGKQSKMDERVVWGWEPSKVSHYYQPGEKLNVAGKAMPELMQGYQQFAFLDDDLSILSVDDVNHLFQIGEALRLPLYQPSLTPGSYSSHTHLVETTFDYHAVRQVPFVEIMCPFFSRPALMDCLDTFDINESGWGLDCFVWPKIVRGECYVVNPISFGHYRQPQRRERILRNGLTPFQELWIQQVINDPDTAPPIPPGYKPVEIEQELARIQSLKMDDQVYDAPNL